MAILLGLFLRVFNGDEMALKIYTQQDCNTQMLKSKHIGIIGFGAQGKAQAQNLKDGGYVVKIGLKDHSNSIPIAQNMGFETLNLSALAQECQVIVFLLPDEFHKEAFHTISPFLTPHHILCFSHGFSIHFQEIIPPSFVDVILVAPKGAGYAVREEFLKGRGVISLFGVHQNHSGDARKIALEYACALGSGKSAIFESSFKDECECDLFSEQSVICGGVSALIQAGFQTLTQAGYPAEIAYFECLHELKLIADLLYTKGIEGMKKHISNTAEYGDMIAGHQIINEGSKSAMKEILQRIQNGDFAKAFLQERDQGFSSLLKERERIRNCELEITGKKMRDLMAWLKD